MTSLPRKRRKFVGKTNGHLNDYVKLLTSHSKIGHVDLCYACLFIKDLPCAFIYSIAVLLYLSDYVDYVHGSDLSSFMNLWAC